MNRKKAILYHLYAIPVILFIVFVYKCPMNYFLGIPCPGCGLTRAHLAALRLDFKSAFGYHPLFFLPLPMIVYVTYRDRLPKHLPFWAEKFLLFTVVGLFLVVYVIRMAWQ